jgi:hypothetical protein
MESSLYALKEILATGLPQDFYLNSSGWILEICALILTTENLRQLLPVLFDMLAEAIYQLDDFNQEFLFIYSILCCQIKGREICQ